MPLRDRNQLLLAAGYAPVYPQAPLDSPGLRRVLGAVGLVLRAHEPWPAVAVDRLWNLVSGNAAVPVLTAGVAAHLLRAGGRAGDPGAGRRGGAAAAAARRRELRLLSTVSTFGTPLDVTVEELSIETFLPGDEATAAGLRAAVA